MATIEARYAIWLYATGAVLLLAAAVTAWLHCKQQRGALIAVLALSGLLAAQLPLLGHEEYATRKSSYQLASVVRPLLATGSTVYSVQNYDQTLPFYLQRTVQLVDYQDEFKLGQQAEPDKLIDFNAFEQRWRAEAAPVTVLEQPAYERMKADDLPVHTLYTDEKRLVVTK
ncbi:hypothetical protein IGB42_04203 [Andreprevotia sp. IGB-42]|uniref:hypothetical protein n=1 Tax=Andreprevotia sp. IGB-42 TaxID=2497473 RepID=UPI001359C699|nr:hypothetical protein [Andreprevotia sp. IGB-42]KAF0811308.1 hypothetical protein IGB42_04203 [Andreprevotia sp. IGB-42]